jgi:hypothetical protein
MVGKQQRWMGAVSRVDHGATTRSAERSYLRGDEQRAAEGGAGAIASHSTRSNPPPKHKANYLAQPSDIGADSLAAPIEPAGVSASSLESTCSSASESTFASPSVSTRRRASPRQATGDVGRDAARDVGRASGHVGAAERWLALLAPVALPPGVECTVNDSHSKWYRLRLANSPLTVTLEIEIWQGELWAHLAITGRSAPPSLAELSWCRDLFLGDRKAIQVLPRKLEAAEAGARTVHLYAQLETDTLPSCSRAGHPSILEHR